MQGADKPVRAAFARGGGGGGGAGKITASKRGCLGNLKDVMFSCFMLFLRKKEPSS